MDSDTAIHTTEDVVGLAIFAGIAGLAIHGARKISKKIKREDSNDIKWF
jgi:hypothetical protein